jgi:hypothetical protein
MPDFQRTLHICHAEMLHQIFGSFGGFCMMKMTDLKISYQPENAFRKLLPVFCEIPTVDVAPEQ